MTPPAKDTESGARREVELVLVGGGHAHVQVLRRWMMDPLPGVHLTLVVDRYEAAYSGMVPGLVAGDYTAADLTIDVLPLARLAGARCIRAAVTRVDPARRRLELEGRPSIAYDVASLDVGSTVRSRAVRGLAESGVATRPIAEFIAEVESRLVEAAAQGDSPLRVAVVGAGPAGVELAFCVESRLRAGGRSAEITLLASSDDLLPGGHRALAPRLRRALERRGIALRCGARVVEAGPGEIRVEENGGGTSPVPCDLALWATGPAALEFLAASGLPCDERGFVRVRSTFQVEGFDDLFAAGDCAFLVDHPWVPRAGVYAVRAGPPLDANLRAQVAGHRLRAYRPQRDFLALINLGDGRAAGSKWGLAFEGRWVWRLKNWIDRRFMERFQVLGPDGRPAPDFQAPAMESADDMEEEMECGGCAAKVGPSPLRAALARLDPPRPDASVRLGLEAADDAAAFEVPGGDLVLATIDAFRAFTDDPWLVGRVAAVNAASDLLAKGARPRHALALVTVPRGSPGQNAETLYQVLAGVRAALDPLGVSLVGGHSTAGPELFVGLSVTGDPAPGGQVLGLDGLEPGNALVLSKPLGTGVLLAADARGLAPSRWMEPALASMLRDNARASELAVEFGARACTDVSGFGLAGHLDEMLRASGVGAELGIHSLPLLPGALDLAERGLRSSFFDQNAEQRGALLHVSVPPAGPAEELLFDPQTSGGLLMGVDAGRAGELVAALADAGDGEAAVIGRVVEPEGPAGVSGPRIRLVLP